MPNPVSLVPPVDAGLAQGASLDDFTADVGWTFLQVDRFVERATPPETMTVLEGAFDEDAMSHALGETDDGVWVAGNPDGSQDLEDRTPARPLGQTQWLTLDGDTLTVDAGREPDEVAGETFADDAAMASVADALDGADAYAAMLVRPGPTTEAALPAPNRAEVPEDACQNALAAPAAVVGTGLADDDGPMILVALAHGSADAAEANAEALEAIVEDGSSFRTRQPWSELVSLDDIEVDGDTVIARLRPPADEPVRASLWYQVIQQRDGLVAAC